MAEREVQQGKENGKNATPPTNAGGKTSAPTSKKDAPSSKNTTSVSAQSTSKKQPSKDVNKEVMLLLQELNTNLNAQNAKIVKQDETIEQLMNSFATPQYDESYCYDEDNGEFYPDDGEAVDESLSQHSFPDSEPPNKRQKTGVFSALSQKYQQAEVVDNEINDDLASFVNTPFRTGISEDKENELFKEIQRPSNCESLVKTRVNPGIWRLLKPYTQTEDGKMQKVQNMVVKATSNLVKLLDKNSESFDTKDLEWGTNSVALLGQANKLINCRRKEMHKADLDPKYHYLASSSLPFTELLYGEDVDVNKNMREINDMNRLGRNLGRGPYFNTYPRAGYRGRRQRRGYPRFSGRGRMPARAEAPSAPKNQRPTYKKQ